MLPIEQVQAGDLVWSRDERSGKEDWRAVVRTFVTPNKDVLRLSLMEADQDKQELRVTAEHPFWRPEGWTEVRNLQIGEYVRARDGWATVIAIDELKSQETVYNFEVAEFHTYFVGDGGVWVHNNCIDVARALSLGLRTAGCRYECIQHAEDLVQALRKAGIRGTKLIVNTDGKWVLSNKHRTLGKQGDPHIAVRVGDTVLDNMNPGGISYKDWINDLGGDNTLDRLMLF